MKYNKISYIDKLDALQSIFEYSAKLAEAIGVSRRTLPNWRDKPESIKAEHRLFWIHHFYVKFTLYFAHSRGACSMAYYGFYAVGILIFFKVHD